MKDTFANTLGRVQARHWTGFGAYFICCFSTALPPTPRVSFPPPHSAPSSWLIESVSASITKKQSVLFCVCQGGGETWTGFTTCQAHITHVQCREHLQKALVPALNRCTIKSCPESFPLLSLSPFLCSYHLFFVSSGSKQSNKRLSRWLHQHERFHRTWPCSTMAPHSTAGLQAGQSSCQQEPRENVAVQWKGAHISHQVAANLSA